VLLDSLNDEQRAAVRHLQGPALVIAGAGSGKTRTVVHRIAYLLAERGVYPHEILAVTFTNKAAGELKERVERLIGQPSRELWVSTFHSACLRVLRRYGELIGLEPGFAIYDDSDQLDLLQEIIERVQGPGEANPRVLRAIIDRAKSNLWSPEEFARAKELGGRVAGMPAELVSEVYRLYQLRLRQANAVDFNDILGHSVALFEQFSEVLDEVQQRAVFIHVDEYQDTNTVQYRLTRQLASKYQNLMVVGDPDQSIYAFRGADVRNILDFQHDYQGAVVYRLEANYRSVGAVLKVANALISHNQERLEKLLRPVKGDGAGVKTYRATGHRDEADFVARQIERLTAERGLSPASFAVLYRTNAQSRVLEEALRRLGIPAKIVGGVGFYERREVKDILSYARAALNPADDLAWKRILNRPRRGIGKTSEEHLAAWAAQRGVRFSDALRQAGEVLKGTPAVKKIHEFSALMADLTEAAEALSAPQFLRLVLDASRYMLSLKAERSFESQARIENLEELVSAVTEWQDEGGGPIGEFLDEAALLASVDDRAVKAVNQQLPAEAVTLMTIHNAKGLEFAMVFLAGLEEGLMPHRSSTGSIAEIEEERRLMYVGITRAQEELYLVHCGQRMIFGRTEFKRPSRFLEEIPKALLSEVDLLGREVRGDPNRYHRPVWTPPSAGASTPQQGTLTFRGGEKVTHPKFGAGTVVGVSGEGGRAEVTVVFREVGVRRLLVKYANLNPA